MSSYNSPSATGGSPQIRRPPSPSSPGRQYRPAAAIPPQLSRLIARRPSRWRPLLVIQLLARGSPRGQASGEPRKFGSGCRRSASSVRSTMPAAARSPDGNIVVSNTGSHKLLHINPRTGEVMGTFGRAPNGGPENCARLSRPRVRRPRALRCRLLQLLRQKVCADGRLARRHLWKIWRGRRPDALPARPRALARRHALCRGYEQRPCRRLRLRELRVQVRLPDESRPGRQPLGNARKGA